MATKTRPLSAREKLISATQARLKEVRANLAMIREELQKSIDEQGELKAEESTLMKVLEQYEVEDEDEDA